VRAQAQAQLRGLELSELYVYDETMCLSYNTPPNVVVKRCVMYCRPTDADYNMSSSMVNCPGQHQNLTTSEDLTLMVLLA
jgi:hypothetical protein